MEILTKQQLQIHVAAQVDNLFAAKDRDIFIGILHDITSQLLSLKYWENYGERQRMCINYWKEFLLTNVGVNFINTPPRTPKQTIQEIKKQFTLVIETCYLPGKPLAKNKFRQLLRTKPLERA